MRSAMLEALSISMRFGKQTVLSNVSVRLEPATTTGLVGGNASGKTTLLNICSGALKPSGGEVLVDGRSLYSPRSQFGRPLRLRIGRSFQEARLYRSLTVAEIFRIGRCNRELGTEILGDLCPSVGMAARVRTLSTGQRRCVELSQLFGSDAEILLLDEPFAGLSSRAREGLVAVIARFSCARSILVCDHNRDLVSLVSDSFVDLGQRSHSDARQ